MTKVFPNASAPSSSGTETSILTVWKKSMLLSCEGFTVFNADGNLVYRVDNYIANNKGEILLMDAAGSPLFTIRRKRSGFLLALDSWVVYEGEETTGGANPRFSATKKHKSANKCLARVEVPDKGIVYEIEGCYGKRCCAVYDEKRRTVAEIKRKEAAAGGRMSFGLDVFCLVVQPQIDAAVAMALLVLLDQMFPTSNS